MKSLLKWSLLQNMAYLRICDLIALFFVLKISRDLCDESNNREQFQCSDGCIFSKYVCDGESDCTGGEDEENCLDYLTFFRAEADFKVHSMFNI